MVAETCVSNIVVTQKHTKNYYLSYVGHGTHYFAGARVQQSYKLGNLFRFIAKRVFPLVKKGAKALENKFCNPVSSLLWMYCMVKMPKAAGLILLHVAQRNVGKQKTAPRKVQKKKRKKHYDIFT